MRVRARFGVAALCAIVVAACAPGTPDLGFSPSGSVTYAPGIGGAGGGPQVVAQADGGVIASLSSARPLTRIRSDGVVDPAWGATLPNECRSTSRTIATGTSILFTCSHFLTPTEGEAWQVWRVTSAGQLDPTFGGGDGIVDVPDDLDKFDIVPLPNGGYFGLGHAVTVPSPTSVPPLVAIVYSANGTTISTTPITIPVQPLPAGVTGYGLGSWLAPTPGGVAAVEALGAAVGNFQLGQSRVQHFDANGAVVDSPPFSGPGTGTEIGTDAIAGLVGLSDGRTAIIGNLKTVDINTHRGRSESYLRVSRADGSADPDFGEGGKVVLRLPAGSDLEAAVLLTSDDEQHLVVAGATPSVGPVVARYDADTGALDPTFGDQGTFPVFLNRVLDGTARADLDQLYFVGYDSQNRPAVSRVWNHTTG